MMQFNLNNLIRDHELDVAELAKVLFPTAKYPKLALDRILKNEASLSVEQLEKLAAHMGVTPSQLFTFDSWYDATENGYLAFKKGPFLAKLNFNGAFLTLYKDGEVVDRKITGIAMSMDEFIKYLNNLITKFN